jgi:hypothetical protein
VQVSAAAARFHLVRTEAWVVLDPDFDQADLLNAAGNALDGYLHPVSAATPGPVAVRRPLQHVALVRRC